VVGYDKIKAESVAIQGKVVHRDARKTGGEKPAKSIKSPSI
jgi:hypothetical protein